MSKTNEKFKLYSVPSEKLVLMSVCTYSFYCWYWLFKNWSSICKIRKKKLFSTYKNLVISIL
jgi:hypothetical protein